MFHEMQAIPRTGSTTGDVAVVLMKNRVATISVGRWLNFSVVVLFRVGHFWLDQTEVFVADEQLFVMKWFQTILLKPNSDICCPEKNGEKTSRLDWTLLDGARSIEL